MPGICMVDICVAATSQYLPLHLCACAQVLFCPKQTGLCPKKATNKLSSTFLKLTKLSFLNFCLTVKSVIGLWHNFHFKLQQYLRSNF